MNKYTTIIFDLDGTLLDTLEDLKNAVNHVLAAHGYPIKTLEEIRKSVGNGTKVLLEKTVPGGSSNPDFNNINEEYQKYYFEHCNEKTGPYKGVREAMKQLKDKGYKMAIVSNKPDSAVKELRDKYFGEYLNVAIGDKEGRRRKPYPDSVFAAIEELGADHDECIYIGDSEVDFLTAENSGLPCISCLWGFRTQEELMSNGVDPENFIKSPDEIMSKIEKMI